MKLMLCAGTMVREGWITLDANPERHPNILAKIPPLPEEVISRKWDEIELIHGITSFYPWEADQLLTGIKNILEPAGKLILEQPNASKCDPVKNPEWLFGDPALREPLHMNKWTYTPESLTDLLLKTGFRLVKICPAQHHSPARDFRLEAFA